MDAQRSPSSRAAVDEPAGPGDAGFGTGDAAPAVLSEAPLAHSERVEVGALLAAAALLRMGVVGVSAAVIFDLNDLAGGKPSNLAISFVGAAQSVSEMVFAFALARLADRFGRGRFLVGAPLVGLAGVMLLTLVTHPAQFAATRVLEGVAAAAFVPTALGTIAAATAHDRSLRARASGAFEGATLVGYAGGFLVGPFAYHWLHRGAFPLLGGLYLGAAAICLLFVPRVPPLPLSPLRVVVAAITGPGPIRTFIPAWLAVNGLVGAWYVNITALLKRTPDAHTTQTLIHGFDERVIGLFLLCWVVLLVLGIVLWTPFLRRHGGPETMLRAVPGVFIVCSAFLLMNHLPLWAAPLVLPLLIVGILVQAGFGPAAVAYLADCSESLVADRSALMAFYIVTLAGGGAVGALIGGRFAEWMRFDGLIVLGFLLGTLALVTLRRVAVVERERRAGGGAPAAARGVAG